MLNSNFKEDTKPLMRPHQAEKIKGEAKAITDMLSAPLHVQSSIENRSRVYHHLKSLKRDLETQVPKPYQGSEVDAAKRREQQLREEITQGMPTQAEMRKNPVGAVDKHRVWQHYNKKKLLEWKNIRLRQHASGDVENLPFSRDVANFERYRPWGGAQELNMDQAQIQGKDYHLPPAGAGQVVVMTDERQQALNEIDPELASKMAVLSNRERADIAMLIDKMISRELNQVSKPVDTKMSSKAKGASSSYWTPERRAEQKAKMKAYWAEKNATKPESQKE